MKKLLFVPVFILMLSMVSCASVSGVFNKTPEERVKQLELGMTKKQVTDILGKTYKPLSLENSPSGRVETLSVDVDEDWRYVIKLLDGRLENWARERIPSKYTRSDYYVSPGTQSTTN